jgi:hypothetical protein
MEAAGMMAAAEYRRHRAQTLVVRGISDHVNADKQQLDRIGGGALRKLAMANAWRLVALLMQFGKLPLASAPTAPENTTALAAWQRRLEFLLTEHATAVGPDEKFAIRQRIEEAEAMIHKLRKLRKLGGQP